MANLEKLPQEWPIQRNCHNNGQSRETATIMANLEKLPQEWPIQRKCHKNGQSRETAIIE
jgi:hypothetical protein